MSDLSILQRSAQLWFICAVFGQWFFAYYIAVFYGSTALDGDWAAWSKRMIHGIVAGDPAGNAAVIVHIGLAFVISFAGPLQLIPAIRRHFPKFHRYNGRVYVATALVISLGAMYMSWTREIVLGGLLGNLATTLDATLIICFSAIAVRHAKDGKVKLHRRWALRLFMMVNVVWFYRIGRGFWMLINDGKAIGGNNTLTGPFDYFLNYGGIILPLLFLQLYFYAQDKGNTQGRYAVAVVIALLSIATLMGTYQAAQMFWLPKL